MQEMVSKSRIILVLLGLAAMSVLKVASQNYGDALTKCILFFEGQRSGKLPSTQRMTWRKDSALHDGSDIGVSLYFEHAVAAIRWGTDYFLKSTSVPGTVVAQIGDPISDHNCWERPEDMDTLRTTYVVNQTHPGSEVSAEIAAALAASSLVSRLVILNILKSFFKEHPRILQFKCWTRSLPILLRFQWLRDELFWGAAWLYKATNDPKYWDYILRNISNSASSFAKRLNSVVGNSFAEFGWDSKDAGINVLVSKWVMNTPNENPFIFNADRFVCSILPESPTISVTYSPGGLLFKPGGSNLQHATSLSLLLIIYARYLEQAHRVVSCGNVVATPARIISVAKGRYATTLNTERIVDYILGKNPLGMSYMVGYGNKYPQKIHHRGSTLPSIDNHPGHIGCHDGTPYFESEDPNPNVLVGALVGGPDNSDQYVDGRVNASESEPTTYMNAPFVGVLAYFKSLQS
ncbi:hypothetical protein GH714_026389 [Hevea brasiliensis]|uniref:Endoglucanase n=1 Tax=Hevea brasiliensis TaxID=3981 RepID=A0A6A6MH60_HEVBR|nr:hypothetical protein GH714_026389 [Hevea brasiliensis]